MVGNTCYQANIFVGGVTGLFALHQNTDEFRFVCSGTLGASLLSIIFFGDVNTISVGLGLVVLMMATMFAVSAGEIGVDFVALGEGLKPSIPEGGAILALSMIGTTALPYNLFLASSLASKNTVASMQTGLAFSTSIAAIASTLIIIVGSAVTEPADMEFSIADLQQVLRTSVGDEAVIAFSLGLFAAAFSAALGVALGAGLSIQSLLSNGMEFVGPTMRMQAREARPIETAVAVSLGVRMSSSVSWRAEEVHRQGQRAAAKRVASRPRLIQDGKQVIVFCTSVVAAVVVAVVVVAAVAVCRS
jgi:hypothetical protein